MSQIISNSSVLNLFFFVRSVVVAPKKPQIAVGSETVAPATTDAVSVVSTTESAEDGAVESTGNSLIFFPVRESA